MPSAFTIRAARVDDAEAIDEACCAAWEWAYEGIVTPELMARGSLRGRRLEGNRTHAAADDLFLVAELLDRGVVGFAVGHAPPTLSGYDTEIGGLYVHPNAAGRGLGKGLFDEFRRLSQFKSLCIHTLQENAIGRRFYEKMGGDLVGEDHWNDLPAVWYGWPRS